MTKLSKRQQQILEFIKQEVKPKGYPPSVRETWGKRWDWRQVRPSTGI